MSKQRITKPVSFNPEKEDEQEMLHYLSNKTFSQFIKRLLFAEMRRSSTGEIGAFVHDDYDEEEDVSSYL